MKHAFFFVEIEKVKNNVVFIGIHMKISWNPFLKVILLFVALLFALNISGCATKPKPPFEVIVVASPFYEREPYANPALCCLD